ncbi:MAG: FAD-binding oxidoreductase, partial [Ktedonobacterales bacterium]|nr:FAD-binding oxidoreductase [Ktedonobacterales bacterium]
MKSRIPLRDEELSGWGGYGGGRCRVACPRDAGEVAALFTEARRVETTLAFRGAGYSYSDAALNRAAIVVDMTAMCRILAWDAKTGLVTAQPGVTFAQLWRTLLPDGWWPNVAPDASAVTLGGAGAANIAGTNGWHAGFFGDTVLSLDLLLPSGATLICDRERNAEVFNAAIGGLGLFGCITALTLQARRVHSGNMWEISSAHPTLSELVEALEGAAEWATSLVAWIDPQARGGHLGRGILRAARDLAPDEEPHPATTLALAHQLPAPSRAARVWEATHLFRLPEPLAGRLARRGQWRRGQGIN